MAGLLNIEQGRDYSGYAPLGILLNDWQELVRVKAVPAEVIQELGALVGRSLTENETQSATKWLTNPPAQYLEGNGEQ